jgi:hypothetical protein
VPNIGQTFVGLSASASITGNMPMNHLKKLRYVTL